MGQNLLRSLILFLIIFDLQMPGLPNGVGGAFVGMILLAPLFFRKGQYKGWVLSSLSPFFLLFGVVLVYALVRVGFNGGLNFEYLLSIAKALTVLMAVAFYVEVFRIEFDAEFIRKVLMMYCINAVINFVVGTYPDLFAFLSIFRGEQITQELGDNPYRNSFISGSGYYSIGTAYGVFGLWYIFYIVRNGLSLAQLTMFATSVLAGIMAARTSMVAFFAGFVYMISRFQVKYIFNVIV